EFRRVALSPDLQILRKSLKDLIPVLEAKPGWYGSIHFERKSSKTLMANLKNSQVSDQVIMGAVLRILDGYTLFEHATDDLNPESLKKAALEFSERVASTPKPSGATHRQYQPANWKLRLAAKLDPEITSQIPADANASTEVHFGIRFKEDPSLIPNSQVFEKLQHIIGLCKTLAPECGLKSEDLTYVMSRQTFAHEEFLFLDREVNMSQSLFRVSNMIILMSGSDRTYQRIGGLGGLEAIRVNDKQIRELLTNLKSLKQANRLVPGKYRVLFGPVISGVLAHEAFGHSQEGDTCARGRSKAWELHKKDERVGNKNATILNNPAVFKNADEDCGAWGSYFFDEEGWLAQVQILLDQGRLCPPMTNLTSALRLGIPRTANGKRETWANGVYTRQTNTYFSPGDKTLSELMAELGDGFVALHPAGGMEDPKGMGIQVGIAFLQEVKRGKLTGRVFKGPVGGDIQMTGYTPDILNSIHAKSKIEFNSKDPDRVQHPFNDTGGCGKYHKEFVYAGCGGPYMLLDPVILG
ncbi:MAG: hypothetical protein A2Z97_10235, partial [Bdellovibrionales bacterium GWB1_52_6]